MSSPRGNDLEKQRREGLANELGDKRKAYQVFDEECSIYLIRSDYEIPYGDETRNY